MAAPSACGKAEEVTKMKISHQHPSGLSAEDQRQLLISLHGQCIAAIRSIDSGRIYMATGIPKGATRGR